VDLDHEARTRLREPRRLLTVNFPVRMDDGSVRSFTGYRVQHTLTMGPTKGGLRYSPAVSQGECAALAMWMTWKCPRRSGRTLTAVGRGSVRIRGPRGCRLSGKLPFGRRLPRACLRPPG
jgi:glutamate/leucine/phenylalanine/valine dehydrogenase